MSEARLQHVILLQLVLNPPGREAREEGDDQGGEQVLHKAVTLARRVLERGRHRGGRAISNHVHGVGLLEDVRVKDVVSLRARWRQLEQLEGW